MAVEAVRHGRVFWILSGGREAESLIAGEEGAVVYAFEVPLLDGLEEVMLEAVLDAKEVFGRGTHLLTLADVINP